jgi:hypothetical protein
VDLWFRLESLGGVRTLGDATLENGQGWRLATTTRGTVELVLNDGRTENRWDTEPGLIEAGKLHHLAAIVDAGPSIVSFVVDGQVRDGGDDRQFGWGRISPNLNHANGADEVRVAPGVQRLRVYSRALRVSEAVGNYRAGI